MDNALELLDLKVYNYTYTVPIVTNDTHLDKVDLSPFKLYPLDEAKNTTKPVKPAKPAKPAKKPVKVIIRNKKKHVTRGHARKDKIGYAHGHGHIGYGKPCIVKIKNKRHRHGHGHKKGSYKKYVFPMLLGLMTAKAILLPFILKLLGLLASKGLLLGIVSTIMASFLSLKKILEPPKYESKRSDVTKIEVVPIPVHHDHHEKSFHHPSDIDIVYEDINVHNPYNGHYNRWRA